MPSIQKTAKGWRVQVFVKGSRDSATFRTKPEASAWGLQREAQLRELSEMTDAERYTLRDALARYADEVTPHKRGAAKERVRIDAMCRGEVGELLPLDVRLCDLAPDDFRPWRDKRVRQVETSTVLRDMGLLSSVLTTARREWRWIAENPLSDVRRPKAPDHREVIITPSQVRQMLRALAWHPGCRIASVRQAVAGAFLMALRSGMRAGEVAGLRWDRVHADYCQTPHKTGRTTASLRSVPLSRQALRVIEQMRGWDDVLVFGVAAPSLDAMFRKYRNRAGLSGFTFHDSRHTAATMLARRLDVMDLCKAFGWANPRQAMTYYNPSASDIAGRLARR